MVKNLNLSEFILQLKKNTLYLQKYNFPQDKNFLQDTILKTQQSNINLQDNIKKKQDRPSYFTV